MRDKLHYYTLGPDRFVKGLPANDVAKIRNLRYTTERKKLVDALCNNQLSVGFLGNGGQSAYEGVNLLWKKWQIPYRLVTEPRHARYQDPRKMIRVQTIADWERSRKFGLLSVVLTTPMGKIPAHIPVFNY